jgi:hypothetical protein
VIQLHRPAGFLEHKLSERGMVVQVTGAQTVDGQVEYQLLRGGQPCQFREPEHSVLMSFGITGVTLTDAQLGGDGILHYTVKEL